MKKTVIASCILAQLSGCASTIVDGANGAFKKNIEHVSQVMQTQYDSAQDGNAPTTKVKGVWLGGKSVPFKNNAALPEVLKTPQNFLFPGRKFTIDQAAAIIQSVTNIPVRVAADVALKVDASGRVSSAMNSPSPSMGAPSSSIGSPMSPMAGARPGMPSLGGAAPGGVPSLPQLPGASTLNSLSPSRAGVPSGPVAAAAFAQMDSFAGGEGMGGGSIVMNVVATPEVMLNQICAVAGGLSWEYREGSIVIQRYVSRYFALKTVPGVSTFDVQAGKSATSSASGGGVAGGGGGGGGAISTGFRSAASVSSQGSMDPMTSVVGQVKLVLSPEGKVSGNPATGSILVVDSLDNVEKAARVIERENDVLTRGAKFRVEVISFTDKSSDEVGVDINAVIQTLSERKINFNSPETVLGSAASNGQIGYNILSGKYTGSAAIIQALSERGKVSTLHGVDVQTRNRNMTPLAIQTQTVYLAQTTPGISSLNGTPGAPGLTPGVATTGFNISMQPNILDSNQIALQLQVGLIDLIDMKVMTSGSGDAQQSIQAPQTSGFEFKQDVFVNPGETIVLAGYERTENGGIQRSLGNNVPILMGGSAKANTKKEKIFILITPTVVGNAY